MPVASAPIHVGVTASTAGRPSVVRSRIGRSALSIAQQLLLRGYDLLSGVCVATTCPSFTGSVGPGLKDVRTVPSFPSRR